MTELKIATEEDIQNLKTASDPRVSPDGRTVAFELSHYENEKSNKSIWSVSSDGRDIRQLTSGDSTDSVPRWSPDGKTLGFLSNRDSGDSELYQDDWQIRTRTSSKASQIYLLPMTSGEAVRLTNLSSGVLNPRNLDAFVWSADGKNVAFLSTDSLTEEEERRLKDKDDAFEFERYPKYTRLYVTNIGTGETRCISPEELHVWEFAWSPDNEQFAVVSSDLPYEGSWFTSCRLVLLSIDTSEQRVLHQSVRQVAMPTWSPFGKEIAFLSSNYSDRGSVDGDVFTISTSGGSLRHVTLGHRSSVRNMVWLDDATSILVTSTDQGGMSISEIDVKTGDKETLWNDFATVSDVCKLDTTQMNFAVIKEDALNPPDVWLVKKLSDGLQWKQLTTLNPQTRKFATGIAESVHWKSTDGMEIQGLLIRPLITEEKAPYPLFVAAHGGPTSSVTPSYIPRWYRLLAEGIAVFSPNFRGSTGFGLEFAEANIGDMGGMDWIDIDTGIDSLVERGIADPKRLGIGGGSYGGYMTGWAVTQTTRFKAAVARAGIYDWRSFHGNSYLNGWEVVHYGGTSSWEVLNLWEKFSPINYVRNVNTPTLILHGERDLSCPVEGAYAFFRSLEDLGVETELVVYPREGHGTEEEIHKKDEKRRTDRWIIDRLV